MKPTNRTMVSGATVLDFRGVSLVRLMETMRTEWMGRLLASLLDSQSCHKERAMHGSVSKAVVGLMEDETNRSTHQMMFPIWLMPSL
jgi:hypothetical protein